MSCTLGPGSDVNQVVICGGRTVAQRWEDIVDGEADSKEAYNFTSGASSGLPTIWPVSESATPMPMSE
jgi:hypothetical protein